ncbi:MAG: hypothetical protein A2901_02455 [Elusimicrobia bacterium RIFCSPLOWO2_01_FULL_54_10]|nr:MAG: hypothetical protein A2901_02455 [Elusimicrobia bacterium RIFCSPLOWO2_01_FULL_54_10]
MPSIQRLYNKTKGKGTQFVLVSNEHPNAIAKFMKDHKLDVPVYFCKSFPSSYSVRTIPSTFIISTQGKIIGKHAGSANWDCDEAVEILSQAMK